ncbi:MAG: DUF4249 domain-containing protein [Bacteroidota bacterium]|nr:DUF4249 domain-containing protein [Bacteroidota bacterium]
MKTNILSIAFSLLSGFILFSSCSNLQKEVKVSLPPYEQRVLVECYIESGKPLQALISATQDYFGPKSDTSLFTEIFLNPGADVKISDGLKTITLNYDLTPQFYPSFKIFNYKSSDSLVVVEGRTYTITATDSKGRQVDAKATYVKPTQITEIEIEKVPNNDSLWQMSFKLIDPPGKNYYQVEFVNLSDSNRYLGGYVTDDGLFDGKSNTFGFQPQIFKDGDTVQTSLYSLSKEYFTYLSTVQAAKDGAGSPFAQPAVIASNINKGIGIFTIISVSRKNFVVKY